MTTNNGPSASGRYVGAQSHSDGDRCDLEYCQGCGHAFTTASEGWYVEPQDVGPDAEGETARLFREDAENFGEWQGFKEEDIGPWCDSCSWPLQRRRTKKIALADGGMAQSLRPGGDRHD